MKKKTLNEKLESFRTMLTRLFELSNNDGGSGRSLKIETTSEGWNCHAGCFVTETEYLSALGRGKTAVDAVDDAFTTFVAALKTHVDRADRHRKIFDEAIDEL